MYFILRPDFDYTVTVPDPEGDYSKNKDDCEFNFKLDENQKPVIILFGWAGCTDKYLSVYSRIYEAKGFTTIRCIVSVMSMFYLKKHIFAISRKMVQVVENLNLKDRPIIAHIFSNGGSYIYQHFVEAVKSSKKPISIKGVIFDSAPCRTTFKTTYRGTRSAVNQNPLLNLPITLLWMITFVFLRILEFIEEKILRRDALVFRPMENLLKEDNRCPQHFIYSKIDTVIPAKNVEYFISQRKSIGVDVSIQCYEDTDHVKIYPFKKYTYTQSIFNFISKCLNLDSSNV